MNRRDIVLGLAALGTAPVSTWAQQVGKIPRIGITVAGFAPNTYVEALRRGLADLGWVDGKNLLVESRYAEGRSDRYPEFMAEFVAMRVDLIVAGGGAPPVRAAMKITRTIPIVMPAVYDPVAAGLVSSLARPGANVTGQAQLDIETTVKRLELLKLTLPKVQRVAVLRDPSVGQSHTGAIEAAASSLGLRLQFVTVSQPEDLNAAFGKIKEGHAEALTALASGLFTAHRRGIVDFANQHRMAAAYEHRDFVEAGGLLSYGPNFEELWRSAARYVDKILKGTRPADIPIEQPTKFELAVNQKTARNLGIDVAQAILARADRVIE